MRYIVATDDTWRSKVTELFENATLVIIDITRETEALRWEIEEASRSRPCATVLNGEGKVVSVSKKHPHLPVLYINDNHHEFQSHLGRMLSKLRAANNVR